MANVPLVIDWNGKVLLSVMDSPAYLRDLGNEQQDVVARQQMGRDSNDADHHHPKILPHGPCLLEMTDNSDTESDDNDIFNDLQHHHQHKPTIHSPHLLTDRTTSKTSVKQLLKVKLHWAKQNLQG